MGGRLPLHHACRKSPSPQTVDLLIEAYPKGAQIKDDQEKLPIHYACHSSSEVVVEKLLHVYPQSILVKNGFGYTPLAEARAMDNPKMDGIISLLEKFKAEYLPASSKSVSSTTNPGVRTENEVLKNQVLELNKTVASLGKVLQGVAQLGTDIQSSLAKGKDSKQVLQSLSERLTNIQDNAPNAEEKATENVAGSTKKEVAV